MLTYDSAGQIIEAQFTANWGFTPFIFENNPERDMTDVNRRPLAEQSNPYIAVKILYNQSSAAEIGQGAIKRTWGNLVVDFHTLQNKGAAINQANIDNLANIFEYKTISAIVFRNIDVLRPVTAEGWYITPIMLRFYFNR